MRAYTNTCPGCDVSIYRLNGPERFCIDCRLSGIGAAFELMEEPCAVCKRPNRPEFYPGSRTCAGCIQAVAGPDGKDPRYGDTITKRLLAARAARAALAAVSQATTGESVLDERKRAERELRILDSAGAWLKKEAEFAGATVEDYIARLGISDDAQLARVYLTFRDARRHDLDLTINKWLKAEATDQEPVHAEVP